MSLKTEDTTHIHHRTKLAYLYAAADDDDDGNNNNQTSNGSDDDENHFLRNDS